MDVDPGATVIVNAVITNVGGTGYYDDVVDMIDGENMNCPSFDDACVKEVRWWQYFQRNSKGLQSVIPQAFDVSA